MFVQIFIPFLAKNLGVTPFYKHNVIPCSHYNTRDVKAKY